MWLTWPALSGEGEAGADEVCSMTGYSVCLCGSNCVFVYCKAKDMQQMVKLEEEMDRRPATVV